MGGKNSININSNGGPVSVGTVVQGDQNQVGNTITSSTIGHALERAKSAVERLAASGQHADDAAKLVAGHLEALGTEARQAQPSTEKGLSILRTVRENFGWAYPAVKDLAQAVWPELLSLIHGR